MLREQYELKPCPFCGNYNVGICIYDPFDGYQGDCSVHRVWCRGCRAQVEQKKVLDAIAAWNRRAAVCE